MIKFEKYEVVGLDHAIRGMRNPMNSWDKSDSVWCLFDEDCDEDRVRYCRYVGGLCVGQNDLNLMKKLRAAGTDHRKFMRMMVVYVDITAPLYWWKEFDTYKVGTVANSCSTMHKIHDKEFTMEDFSCEHLIDSLADEVLEFDPKEMPDDVTVWADDDTGYLAVTCRGFFHEGHSYEDTLVVSQKDILDMFIIPALNANREAYLKSKDKKYWWQMIQLLPTSYNQKRTVMLNYEVLANIYKSRKDHKLDEWRELCKWIEESLPYPELITGKETE